jgi:hypothetical protein
LRQRSRNDWGQIIEGLEARRAKWEVTARYLEGEEVDQVIEECCDAEEARALVATCDRLIGELRSQLRQAAAHGSSDEAGCGIDPRVENWLQPAE